MTVTRIHRYIIREVLSPTLLSLLIFTLVMIMGRAFKLADLIINKGVSLSDITVLLVTLLPASLSITLPLAFLMGIMIGLGRMSADSETVALKSAGIGLTKIALPVFALALMFSLLTALTNLWAKPWGYRAFETKSFDIARQKMTIGLEPRIFIDQFNNLMIYANEIDDRQDQMRGLLIVEKKPESTSWVFANSGEVHSDEESETVLIRLHDGVIHRQENVSSDNYQLIHFRNYNIQPEVLVTSAQSKKSQKAKSLSTTALWDRSEDITDSREFQAELHLRLSSPLAPLLFVLFGLPFSMQSHRSGRSGGFVVGLVIFLVYYFLLSTSFTLTKDAATPPWLAFWVPHFLLAASGLFFLHRTSLEKPNALVYRVDEIIRTIQKRIRKNVNS